MVEVIPSASAGEKIMEKLFNEFLKKYLENVKRILPDSYRAKQLNSGQFEASLVYKFETDFLKEPFNKALLKGISIGREKSAEEILEKLDQLSIDHTHDVLGSKYGFILAESVLSIRDELKRKISEGKGMMENCPSCKKNDMVILYTKEWTVVDGEEVCPFNCERCDVIWYPKGILNLGKGGKDE